MADLLAVFVSGFVVVRRHISLKFTFGHLVSILRHKLRHRGKKHSKHRLIHHEHTQLVSWNAQE